MKLLMLRGLPASGKSTYAKELVKTPGWKRINKDDLRSMVDNGKWSKFNERMILEIRNKLVELFFENKMNVIVDDTNFVPIHEKTLRELAEKHGAEFEIKDFDTDVDECIKRDNTRANGVGATVINNMWKQYVIPRVEWPTDRESKPKVLICDLDGTLANMGSRSPYDASTCEQDGFYEDVWQVIRSFGNLIIFCSGREEKYREQTMNWLKENTWNKMNRNDLPFRLFMRPTGDSRKDWLVKFEMLRDKIAQFYNPVAVFDDRNRVVDMWRAQGIRVFQVADGNF